MHIISKYGFNVTVDGSKLIVNGAVLTLSPDFDVDEITHFLDVIYESVLASTGVDAPTSDLVI